MLARVTGLLPPCGTPGLSVWLPVLAQATSVHQGVWGSKPGSQSTLSFKKSDLQAEVLILLWKSSTLTLIYMFKPLKVHTSIFQTLLVKSHHHGKRQSLFRAIFISAVQVLPMQKSVSDNTNGVDFCFNCAKSQHLTALPS